MRVERLPEYVTTVTVTAAGIAFALYCGSLTGSGQMQMLVMIFGIIASLAVLMTLRSAIWMLIPIFWMLPGPVPSLPIPLGLRDVVILFVLVCFFLLTALKVTRFRPKHSLLDWLLWANAAYLATVFARNPVGAQFFDSERVGGRPYLNVAISLAAYWVLNRAFASPSVAKRLPWAITGAAMIEGIIGIIVLRFPFLIPILSPFYGSAAFATETGPSELFNPADTGRNTMFMYLGPPVVTALYSRFRPLTLINPFYIIRCAVFAGAFILILLSGFRSLVLAAAAGFLISSYFRGGIRSVVRLMGVSIPALALVVMLQGTFFELPRSAQRALSFLPGQWDPVAVAEAKDSTEWRIFMWKAVLSSDRYIQNKLLGDGFGFSRVEMSIMARGNYRLSPEEMQESYLVMGGYHSGPLTAIRYVGGVGLVLFLALLVALAREGWMLIRQAQGGPYEFLAFFVGIPLIYEPFQFIFIYGSFEGNITASIFAVGMVKMLKNSFQEFGANPQDADRSRSPKTTWAVPALSLRKQALEHRSLS